MKTILDLSVLCVILCLKGITAASTECPAVDPLDHSVYLTHETDCSKFYECSNGVPILLSCPKGTLFNPDLNVCDWPDNVVCQRKTCPKVDPVDTSIYLPHESDCSKFYQCSNGVPILQSCPTGLLFNIKLNVCDYPQNVDSCSGSGGGGDSGSGGNGESGSDNGNDGNGGNGENDGNNGSDGNGGDGGNNGNDGNGGNGGNDGNNGSDGNGGNGGNDGNNDNGGNGGNDGNGSGSGGNGACPAVDPLDHSVYLPHESDCSKFYECSNGVPYELSCPSGLLFNTKLNVCDWPENVGTCSGSGGNGGNDENNGSDGNGGDGGNNGNDGNGGNGGNDDNNGSDGNDGDGGNNGNDGNGGNGGNDENNDNEGSGEEGGIDDNNGNGGNDGNGSGNGACPAVDPLDHSVYLPHESDCSKFYECSNGVPIELSCPSGLLFNTKLNVCDWPENVDTCSGSGGNGGNDGNNGSDGNGGDGGNDGNNGSDGNGGEGGDNSSDDNGENGGNDGNDGNGGNGGNDGNNDNGGNGGNDGNGSGSEGNGACPAVDPLDHSVYLPHESDCSKFYECSNGVPIELSCPSGLLFNTKLNVCDWPENVDSCSGSGGNDGNDGNDGNGGNDGNDGNGGDGGNNGNDGNGGNNDNGGNGGEGGDNSSDDNGENGGNDGNNGSDGNGGDGGNNGSDGNDGNGGNDGNNDNDGNGGTGGDSNDGNDGTGACRVCPAVDPLDHSVYLPHESDCSKFYECSNGVPIELSCPSGLLFNIKLNVCDYPENVESCLNSGCKEDDDDANRGRCIGSCPAVDPLDYSVYLPHVSDCSKFCECSNGVPIELSCPSGLLFNTKLNVCDYPKNVDSCP